MTPSFVSRSSTIISVLVVGLSLSAHAEAVEVMGKVSTDGSFTVAQTNGMVRRQDRRDPGRAAVSRKEPLARINATANRLGARTGGVESTMISLD